MRKLLKKVQNQFRSRFGTDYTLVKSPGRINLIGEHTDYNDGFVLPAAIDKVMIFALHPNGTEKYRFFACDKNESVEIDSNTVLKRNDKQWANYLIGAIDQLEKMGYEIGGFDCVFGGDIPIGAGLSSSAALEGGVLYGLDIMFDLGISKLDMALLGQKVENDFVGVQCGIMDQFVNIHGKEGYALKLDCRSLEFELYPFRRSDVSIILCDTGIRRELADSEYNIRRQQCEEGVRTMQVHNPDIENLRDVDFFTLNKHRDELDPVVYRRCKYVLEENERVEAACDDLVNDDFESFGRRMYRSHYGLRDMFEVSCHELDILVEIAENSNGVLGARMMGGGFGGCTINLVENNAVKTFIDETKNTYKEEIGDDIEIYQASLGDGSKHIPVTSSWKQAHSKT